MLWNQATGVPGLAALNKGANAQVWDVSCASAGNCAAGGYYGNRGRNPDVAISGRGFVAIERNGRWGRAVEVPGLRALDKGGNSFVGSLSCPSPGHCAAGGSFTDRSHHNQGFLTQAR